MMVMPCLLVLRHVYPFKTRPITMDCSHDSVTLSLSLSLHDYSVRDTSRSLTRGMMPKRNPSDMLGEGKIRRTREGGVS